MGYAQEQQNITEFSSWRLLEMQIGTSLPAKILPKCGLPKTLATLRWNCYALCDGDFGVVRSR